MPLSPPAALAPMLDAESIPVGARDTLALGGAPPDPFDRVHESSALVETVVVGPFALLPFRLMLRPRKSSMRTALSCSSTKNTQKYSCVSPESVTTQIHKYETKLRATSHRQHELCRRLCVPERIKLDRSSFTKITSVLNCYESHQKINSERDVSQHTHAYGDEKQREAHNLRAILWNNSVKNEKHHSWLELRTLSE